MDKSKYAWRWGMPVKAEIVGATLEAIEEEHGELTPAIVVDAARPADSPLHALFTWDDSQAAELHRRTEARFLLRNLRINYVKESEPDTAPRILRIPAFPNVVLPPAEDGDADDGEDAPGERRFYMSARVAYENPQARAYIVGKAKEELAAWRNRYANITEFADVVAAIDATIQRMTSEIKLAA